MAKVETITIDVSGKKVEMSMEDARELHSELAKLFDSPEIPQYYYPVIVQREYSVPPFWHPNPVWAGSTSDTLPSPANANDIYF